VSDANLPPAGDFDVVIVGSGLGGLASALFCSMEGLRAIVLEKAEVLGGASCWSYGAIWIGGNDLATAAGISDDDEAVSTYLHFLGGGENTASRTQALVDHGKTALRRLRDAGIQVDLMNNVNDILFGKAPGAAARGRTLEPRPMSGHLLGEWRSKLRTPPGKEWRVAKSIIARAENPATSSAVIDAAQGSDQIAQGSGLIAQFLAALRARDVPILTGVHVDSLVIESGRVAGVRAADGRRWASRLATLLATGNYLSNTALVARLDCLPEYRSWFPESHTGDGLALAAPAGASIGVTRNNLMVMLGYDSPHPQRADAGVPSVRDLPRAHTLIVNRGGARFGNEALFQELAPALRALDMATREPKNLPCWMIFDRQYVDKWGFDGGAPGAVPDWVTHANDLSTLADRTGIDGAGLIAAVSRFNGFADTGIDADFGRKPGWALTPGSGTGRNASIGSIEQAPFYAARLFPTLGGAGAGLRADAAARVLNWQDERVPGLYAVGDVAHHDEFGAGYQAGITFASAMTFACLAAEHIRLESVLTLDNNK
jgi:3-oxosteroid 1-dehydrogenase